MAKTLLVWLMLSAATWAGDWYVSPIGSSGNPGTLSEPWDLLSGLAQQAIQPGDTVWILGGTYVWPNREADDTEGWHASINGSAGNRITVRPYPGHRVTLDGTLIISGSYLIIRDLEVLVSENVADDVRTVAASGSGGYYLLEPQRPPGGVMFNAGFDTHLVNCVIHDCKQGVGFWKAAHPASLYGCVIYRNGWRGSDRKHGHGIYSQNEGPEFKTIEANIVGSNFGYNAQLYGSGSAPVQQYLVKDNFALPGNLSGQGKSEWIMGGLKWNSNYDLWACGNVHYRCGLSIGYVDRPATNWRSFGNRVVMAKLLYNNPGGGVADHNLHWQESYIGGWTKQLNPQPEDGSPIPPTPLVKLVINKWDHSRAHLIVIPFAGETTVDVDVASWLSIGQSWAAYAPFNIHGQPIASGVYDGNPISVDVPTEFPKYTALVLKAG